MPCRNRTTFPKDLVGGQLLPDTGCQAKIRGIEVGQDLQSHFGRQMRKVGKTWPPILARRQIMRWRRTGRRDEWGNFAVVELLFLLRNIKSIVQIQAPKHGLSHFPNDCCPRHVVDQLKTKDTADREHDYLNSTRFFTGLLRF